MTLPRKPIIAAIVAALSLGAVGCSPLFGKDAPAPKPPVVEHRTRIAWLPPSVTRFARHIDEASFRHGVDANLIAIVMLVESGGNPYAISPAGAVGLMQIMPATGRDIALRRGIQHHSDVRLYDPAYNIDLAAWYLARQLERFWNGDADKTVDLAAGAYNGGPARIARGEKLPTETRQYMHWVGGMWRERHDVRSPTLGHWLHAGGARLIANANNPLPPPGAPPIIAGPPLL